MSTDSTIKDLDDLRQLLKQSPQVRSILEGGGSDVDFAVHMISGILAKLTEKDIISPEDAADIILFPLEIRGVNKEKLPPRDAIVKDLKVLLDRWKQIRSERKG